MRTRIISFNLASVLAIVVLSLSLLTPQAHAAYITNESIDDQKEVIVDSAVDTMTEYVKLLQMIIIKRLEDQVTILEAQVNGT